MHGVELHKLLTNRALSYHRLSRHHAALRDARFAVRVVPTWIKGRYRCAVALQMLGRPREV